MLALIILFFLFVFMLELPKLLRHKLWRDLAVFSALWGMGLAISLLLHFEVRLPYVSTSISRFVEMLVKMMQSLLQ